MSGCIGRSGSKRVRIVDGPSQPVTRGDYLWRFLPGSAKELSARTGISLRIVRKILRAWRSEGKIRRTTQWHRMHAYTWIYRKKEEER